MVQLYFVLSFFINDQLIVLSLWYYFNSIKSRYHLGQEEVQQFYICWTSVNVVINHK